MPTPAIGPPPLRFIQVEVASALVLLGAAALALAWANSPFAGAYHALWHARLGAALGGHVQGPELHFLVNDGLMTLFFLVVGLEIRRELADGSLSDPKVATLPLIAALGGVIAPALIYLALNTSPATRGGWAIPTATDIAFAVGVLALVGRGLPPALRLLLLTLAIADDVVAILVIAFVYSGGIVLPGLALAALGVLLVLALQGLSVRQPLGYLVPGALVWLGLLWAGVHPTLAGVILGLLTPTRARYGWRRARLPAGAAAPANMLEAQLHPLVAFGVMPLFALANAGVTVGAVSAAPGPQRALLAGITAGLVLGKPLGIALACLAALRLGVASLPQGVRWPHVLVLGCLGGIGFTMSIFVAHLAFADPALLEGAKLAVLAGSGLAALAGGLLGAALGRAASAL